MCDELRYRHLFDGWKHEGVDLVRRVPYSDEMTLWEAERGREGQKVRLVHCHRNRWLILVPTVANPWTPPLKPEREMLVYRKGAQVEITEKREAENASSCSMRVESP